MHFQHSRSSFFSAQQMYGRVVKFLDTSNNAAQKCWVSLWGCFAWLYTVQVWPTCVGVSGRWLRSCPGLFPVLKRLNDKQLCRLHVGSYRRTRPAAIKSNHTQTKLVGQTAWRAFAALSQPRESNRCLPWFRIDSNQLTWKLWPDMERPSILEPNHAWARESHLKREKTADQQSVRHLSACLSLRLTVGAHSCLVPSETRQSELQAGTRLIAIYWN